MGNLFGKKKHSSRVTEQDKAVLQLKQQRDRLKVYQKRIELQLVKDKDTARQLLAKGNKQRALLMLRKKKYQESLLEKTDKQLESIERMTHDLEFAQIEVEVVKGLKFGNEALNKLHQILSIEDVEKIMDETAAAVEYQKEIDAVLAGGLTAEDEDDVLQELADIIQESQGPISLPEVPDDELPTREPQVPADKVKEAKKQRVMIEA
jgi:charged multivesicular body protein 6